MAQIWIAFITGLTTGGISCLAVQGGLLASSLSSTEHSVSQGKFTKITMFLVAKLIAYTMLGFLLGLLGSKLLITPMLQGWLQIIAGIFMVTTAARLLNLHPLFRYVVIQPPRWAMRLLRNNSKSQHLFAPALLGFLTVLIPCGITQSIMVLSIASANPLLGAAILGAFVLGTSPIFFTLGIAVVGLLHKPWFSYAVATVILVLGIFSINTGQVLRGSSYTLQNYVGAVADMAGISPKDFGQVAGVSQKGTQDVTITVLPRGYKSSATTLKVGIPVTLNLITNNVNGCTRAFRMPSLNISKVLPETGTESINFTPTKTGQLAYTCSMGMYSGQFSVVN